MPIFCVKSVKIYTGQKKITRVYPWRPWQISGMGLICVLSGKIPDSGWWNVQVSCQMSSNYQENTLNVLHKSCYSGVYFSDLFIVLASENLLSQQGSPLKLNFWVSHIITPFRINACTTATTFCQHRALLSSWTFGFLI